MLIFQTDIGVHDFYFYFFIYFQFLFIWSVLLSKQLLNFSLLWVVFE